MGVLKGQNKGLDRHERCDYNYTILLLYKLARISDIREINLGFDSLTSIVL